MSVTLLFIILVPWTECQQLTQTVYGFLDFTTTIGNTVMVFSPQSAPGKYKIQNLFKNCFTPLSHFLSIEDGILHLILSIK